MSEIFFAFRSRTDAIKFYEELQTYKISSKIINTPSSAGLGCGLSVKVLKKYMTGALPILDRMRLNTFAGIFEIGKGGAAIRI